MSLAIALFVIVAFGTATAALGVVFSRGIIRSAIYLLLTLVGVSLTFFMLGAEFLGAAQLIVYVGGTLVLVVFGGMLTAGGPFAYFPSVRKEWLIGGLLSIGLFTLLAATSIQLGTRAGPPRPIPGIGGLGLGFLGVGDVSGGTSYLLPFELVSIHLLVVLIGAAYLARAKSRKAVTTT